MERMDRTGTGTGTGAVERLVSRVGAVRTRPVVERICGRLTPGTEIDAAALETRQKKVSIFGDSLSFSLLGCVWNPSQLELGVT